MAARRRIAVFLTGAAQRAQAIVDSEHLHVARYARDSFRWSPGCVEGRFHSSLGFIRNS
jgi:hypothetical protein